MLKSLKTAAVGAEEGRVYGLRGECAGVRCYGGSGGVSRDCGSRRLKVRCGLLASFFYESQFEKGPISRVGRNSKRRLRGTAKRKEKNFLGGPSTHAVP